MSSPNLRDIAESVVRRAQRQGYIVPREVREELGQAQLPAEQWKDVVALAGTSIRYRQGRYYYNGMVSARLREEQERKRAIETTVKQLIREHLRSKAQTERRQSGRMDFVQPIKVVLENGQELTLLSRDLSITGIRLIGTMSLLGQKVRLEVPQPGSTIPACFLVRILWTGSVGSGLFENGGTFSDLASPREEAH